MTHFETFRLCRAMGLTIDAWLAVVEDLHLQGRGWA